MKFLHLSLAILLAGCSFFGSPPVATPTLAPQATATASPEPQLLILLAPQGADTALVSAAAEIAGGFASEHGLHFQQVDQLSAASFKTKLATLVVLGPDPGAADLAAAAPNSRVIAIGFAPAAQAPNLQVLLASGTRTILAPFIAGYIAGMTADEWRVGMLYTTVSAYQVPFFVEGARYFCGDCTPQGPPYSDYPQVAQAADASDWQAAADQLLSLYVNVVYLPAELETSDAGEYLARYGVQLIGSGAPPAGLEGSWLAGISADPIGALRQQLPQALAGELVGDVSPLSITNVNPSYLSDARLANVQGVISDILAGYIDLSVQQ